jgi:hypothetical protein
MGVYSADVKTDNKAGEVSVLDSTLTFATEDLNWH